MSTTWRATRHVISPADDFHAAMGDWRSEAFDSEKGAVSALVERMEGEARAMIVAGSIDRGVHLVKLSVLASLGRMDFDTERQPGRRFLDAIQPGRRFLDMGVVRWSVVRVD